MRRSLMIACALVCACTEDPADAPAGDAAAASDGAVGDAGLDRGPGGAGGNPGGAGGGPGGAGGGPGGAGGGPGGAGGGPGGAGGGPGGAGGGPGGAGGEPASAGYRLLRPVVRYVADDAAHAVEASLGMTFEATDGTWQVKGILR
ncbi:MAG: hypothetical protein H6706_03170 [Myxococcales bacterium]|nr:hypothetical protein [Myxococcales bacterium]